MAKFHGFEIKSMKTWMGMEGYATQGTVYVNGRKLGTWVNDGNGGDDRFDLPRDAVQELNDLVAEQIPECSLDLGNGHTMPADLSLVLAHLCDMKDLEKEWKKANKRGCSLVSLNSKDGINSVVYEISSTDRRAIMRWLLENAGREMDKHGLGDGSFEIYDSADCFVVGEPLTGAEGAIKRCVEWEKERKRILANIGRGAA